MIPKYYNTTYKVIVSQKFDQCAQEALAMENKESKQEDYIQTCFDVPFGVHIVENKASERLLVIIIIVVAAIVIVGGIIAGVIIHKKKKRQRQSQGLDAPLISWT